MNLKPLLRDILDALGLLPASRAIRERLYDGMSPSDRYRQRQFATFRRRYADTFESVGGKTRQNAKRVLVLSGASGATSRAGIELCLAKALELAGCEPSPLVIPRRGARRGGAGVVLKEYYRLLSPVGACSLWENCYQSKDFQNRAKSKVDACHSSHDLLEFQFGGTRVGGYAVATTRQKLAAGELDLQTPFTRNELIGALAESMAAAVAAREIVHNLRPSLVLTDDTAYTPAGEFLDICAETKVPVVRWFPAHDGSALILKRYRAANRSHDHNSLSDTSWRLVRAMDWNDLRRQELKRELRVCYASGLWYSEAGTQFDKIFLYADAVRERLRLDPTKKTAFIFAHISWDASFGRGQDLFANYEEWFIETVRAACANDKLQWVIKIHPAHTIKSRRRPLPAEEDALRRRIGRLPPHISLLPAENDISTLSLFPVMDYCLTVRGTAGLEAACLGIPVLTGGTGRYDRKGFTIDSETPQQYLERIAYIQDIPRLTPAQIELAERYAYGLFLLRPLALSSVTMQYRKLNGEVFNPVQINLRTRKDWEGAPDLRAFTDWVLNSDEEDFLLPVPEVVSYQEEHRERVAAG